MGVQVEYSEGVYNVAIMGMYSVQNQTSLPLYFRYSDHFSINKFMLGQGEKVRLPLWVIDSINFGIEDDEMIHMLRLRPLEGSEESGYYSLRIHADGNRFGGCDHPQGAACLRAKRQS